MSQKRKNTAETHIDIDGKGGKEEKGTTTMQSLSCFLEWVVPGAWLGHV